MKVLIVDDDPCTRTMLSEYLEAEQFEVLSASDAAEAIVLARIQPSVDQILVDYHMPGMDGLDCIQALCEQRKLARSRVFLMSAEWNVQQAARRAGVGFIRKPLDLPRLAILLKTAPRSRSEAH